MDNLITDPIGVGYDCAFSAKQMEMRQPYVRFKTLKTLVRMAGLSGLLFGLTACATRPAAPVSVIADLPQAVTLPYQLSSSGRLLIDVSDNEGLLWLKGQPYLRGGPLQWI